VQYHCDDKHKREFVGADEGKLPERGDSPDIVRSLKASVQQGEGAGHLGGVLYLTYVPVTSDNGLYDDSQTEVTRQR